jgi:hypothetical protein
MRKPARAVKWRCRDAAVISRRSDAARKLRARSRDDSANADGIFEQAGRQPYP